MSRIRGGELQSGEGEDPERGQGLASGVGGVLGDRQVGRVAEDLVQHDDGLAPGGRDDLGVVGGVLIGDVGVGRGALVEEIARQRPCGEAAAALREPLPVRGRQGAAAPQPSEWVLVVGVDQASVRFAQGVLAQVPVRGPGQDVLGDARGVGHAGVAEVAGVCEHGGVEVAHQVGVSGLGAAGVGECLGESGVALDLDEQRREVNLRQPGGDGVGERVGLGGYLLGGQRRDDQVAVLVSRRASPCVFGSARICSRSVTAACNSASKRCSCR